MTYSAGNTIVATDYNGFAATTVGANINATWNTTYGQTALAQVAVAGTVTATQWSSLTTTLASMAAHSNTTITSRTAPVAGNTISILANVNTDITNCYNNRANAVSSGTQNTAWTGTASQTSGTGTGAAAWQLTFTDTMTFANASAASSFFGAGGLVKVQFSKTSTGLDADPDWNTFISNVCANSGVFLSGANTANIAGTSYTGTTKFGGSGTPAVLATTTNFTNLTTTPVTIYKQFDTGAAYNTNYLAVLANVNSNSSPTVLTLATVWVEDGDPRGGANAQISGGTATTGITFGTAPATVVTYYPPETTNLSAVWGAPTVASTVANSTPGYLSTYLIVAGGGGGGTNYGGGGGGGGVLTGTISIVTGTTYSVTVGTGGAAGAAGANSVLATLTAVGGGYGGASTSVGGAGGSGGGAGNGSVVTGGAPVFGQGYAGGNSGVSGTITTGGGGGASATGGDGAALQSGAGGNGVSSSITGAAATYGGGGGGGGASSNGVSGGAGGDANSHGGAGASLNGTAGTAGGDGFGYGGGGGAGASGVGGKGGNGVVILSVPTASYAGNANVSGTYTYSTSGANTIIKWTAGSGSYIG